MSKKRRCEGRELGARYVLESSVRKSGDRVRITGQMIDTSSGTHLWADRFDGALQDFGSALAVPCGARPVLFRLSPVWLFEDCDL